MRYSIGWDSDGEHETWVVWRIEGDNYEIVYWGADEADCLRWIEAHPLTREKPPA